MQNKLDLSVYPQKFMKSYEGANGNKICLTIDNEDYMIKFPANQTKNENLSYTNSCICEYRNRKKSISQFIYNLGQNTEIIPYDQSSAQICGTFLGTFSNKGKPLPYGDTQIAATAAANGMILVTHNTQDFKEVAERSFLKLEDWFSE